mgnify:FL=1
MATENKKYIPALRFPEIQNDGEWKTDTMETIFDIKNGYTPSKSNSSFWDNGTIPWFRMEDIRKNGHILSDSIQHVTPAAVKNAGLFPAYSIIVATTATIGEHALIIVDSLANQQFTFLTKRKSFDNKLDMMYFHYFMFIIDEWCKKNTNAGGLLSVNMDSFKKLTIPYPSSLSEQKKIADCFVSIDKEIDATKRKLELLKEHKKGLMQRLFPAKGKTTPELRFPEFQNDGEWIPRPLSDILNYEQPTPYIVEDDTYKKEGTPVLTANKGFILGYTDESFGIYSKLPVIIFDDFTTDKKYVDFSFKIKSSAMKLLTLKDEERDNLRFIFECMSNIVFEEKEHKRYYISEYQHINIYVPSSLQEQNQIADTLLSVDKQISEYDKKIKALELHKKGLMQQLFPKL